jgi:alpha-tubulin suppressor-like RCC1 family protein
VAGLTSVASLALHKELACALRNDGSVWCWREAGQTARAPQAVTGLSRVEQIWFEHDRCYERCRVCVQSAQELRCGTTELAGLGSGQPFSGLETLPLGRVRSMAIGRQHSCAALENGSVQCWPAAGSPANTAALLDAGASVAGWLGELSQAEQVAVAEQGYGGDATLCVRLANRSARCGPLSASESMPKPFTIDGVTELFGAGHFGALDAQGLVRCWGDNGAGQLGDGTRVGRSTPAPVTW